MLKTLGSFISKNIFNILLCIFYIAITFITMFYHEIWRDEARVLSFLINYDSLIELFNNIRGDGHPYLWYLILFPFAKSNFNILSMQIISVIFCCSAVIFLLFKSPFDKITKFLIVFSSGMIYYMPIIARSYCLIPLLIFILAYLYKDRHEKPIKYTITLILLSQTHCLIWGFCGILGLFYITENIQLYFKTRDKKLFIVPLSLIFYLIFMLFIYIPVYLKNKWMEINMFLPDAIKRDLFLQGFSIFTIIVLTISIFSILFFFYKSNKKISIIYAFSLVYILYVYICIWTGGIIYQRLFFIILIIIFCNWVMNKEKINNSKWCDYCFNLILVIMFISPLFFFCIKEDIKNTMTNTKEIIEYIKENDKDNKDLKILLLTNFVVFPDNFNLYMPKKVKRIDLDKNVFNKEDLKNYKYIIIMDDLDMELEYPYKEIITPPSNKLKLYNTYEYFTLYENTEI